MSQGYKTVHITALPYKTVTMVKMLEFTVQVMITFIVD